MAGIKIKAHPDFRLVATMNDDASTFELPEYIHSRLQPQITIDFPERDEERRILKENLPFAEARILDYVTDFLQQAHERRRALHRARRHQHGPLRHQARGRRGQQAGPARGAAQLGAPDPGRGGRPLPAPGLSQ